MQERSRWSRLWLQRLLLGLALLIGSFAWRGFSQDKPAAETQHRIPVATVDIAKIFKQHRDFNESMAHLKRKVDEFDREVAFRKAEIDKLKTTKDAAMTAASAEAARKAAYQQATLTADIELKKQEFLAAEAKFYFEAYLLIEQKLGQLARAKGIGVVLRTNSEPMDPTKRDSVLQGVNRAIVFSAAPDLTDEIVADLNRSKF